MNFDLYSMALNKKALSFFVLTKLIVSLCKDFVMIIF